MGSLPKLLKVLFWVGLVSALNCSTAFAQASIAGAVRDASGAVLPGVTVEAASPALIEKVRAAVTDGAGQFRIIDLRPGTYVVTFTLPGFSTVRREGVELTGSFTATVDVELRVGAVEETVTVTGEAAAVDVQSVTRQQVLTLDVIQSMPTNRSLTSLATLLPGVNASPAGTGLSSHGSSGEDQRIAINGISIGIMTRAGQAEVSTGVNPGMVQEMAVDYGAVSAEMGQGGVKMNLIPREGGNTVRGLFFGQFQHKAMQGSNYSDELAARGLAAPILTNKGWDINPGIGGPILQDRLWYWATVRYDGDQRTVPTFYNLNANKPDAWTYVPDTSREVISSLPRRNVQTRFTWQAATSHKVGVAAGYADSNPSDGNGAGPTRAPEAINPIRAHSYRTLTVDYQAPLTNRVLLEASSYSQWYHWGFVPPPGLDPRMISVQEQSTGLVYRSRERQYCGGAFCDIQMPSTYYRAAVSYVTGTHAFKVGFNNGWGKADYGGYDSGPPFYYRFNNGLPNQITFSATPYNIVSTMDADLGLYAQDTWTMDRIVLGLGLRFDYFKASYPEQHLGPSVITPTRDLTFPAESAVSWRDLSPKLSFAYDLFGTGRTAAKVTLNRYVAAQALQGLVAQNNPVGRLVLFSFRSWDDGDRDFVPDCDLTSPVANGECGAIANRDFGGPTAAFSVDPELLDGFGVRGYNWEFSSGIQHEILPRVAVDVSYFRRWFGNFIVANDLSLSPSDFDGFSITAPADSRLPGGGGYTVSGLYDLKPAKFGTPAREYLTLSDTYGKMTRHWNGVDINVTARPGALMLSGGVSTGRTTADNCDMAAQGARSPAIGASGTYTVTPENPSTLYCRVQENVLTYFKAFGSYTFDRPGVQVSATLQSGPGAEIAANYNATSAEAARTLGRQLAGGARNVTVNLVEPGTMYGDRLTKLDLRASKIFRFGRTRTTANLDILNVLNSDTVTTLNNNYAAWLRPTAIPEPIAARISVQFDF